MSNDTNGKSKGESIDPRVEKELEEVVSEEEIFGTYTSEGGESEKVPIVNEWLPDGDQWQGKTIVNEQEAHLLSRVRALPHAFEELEEMEPFIKELVTNLEMYKTSVDGKARSEQVGVLGAMFGSSAEGESTKSMLMGMIAGSEDNE